MTFVNAFQGVEFKYEHKGKAIPPPKEREPSQGNYKQMPEGPRAQPEDVQEELDAQQQEDEMY